MGRFYKEVGQEIKEVPYKVKAGNNDVVVVSAGNKDYTPPELSAMILQKMNFGFKVSKS